MGRNGRFHVSWTSDASCKCSFCQYLFHAGAVIWLLCPQKLCVSELALFLLCLHHWKHLKFKQRVFRFIDYGKAWQTSGHPFSKHTDNHIFQVWEKQYIHRKLLFLFVFSLFSVWQHPWVLNHSCQVGLSSMMTQFQINLSHIFYTVSLTRLQSHWGISLSSCGSALSGRLLCKLSTHL